MKRLIYTAIFGGYDIVYPPIEADPDVDYVIFTDDPQISVPGWRTVPVDMSSFPTNAAANRYYKTLIHRILPGYDASIYVDGNIRLLASAASLFDILHRSGAALALWRHSGRGTVAEEVDDVIATGKVPDKRARAEYETYRADGFPDTMPLGENTIIVRDHNAPKLDAAMSLWWSLYKTHLSRDQLSFGYIVWKTKLELHYLPGMFRTTNPYVAVYPHLGKGGARPSFVHVSARSHDNSFYFVLLKIWQAKWRLQRLFRQLLRSIIALRK